MGKKNCLTYVKALNKLQIFGEMNGISKSIIAEGQKLARKSMIKMGGPGDLDLLFDTVRLTNATKVIETGVAYGWSSLAILHAMSLNKNGALISVDMPYPKMGNEPYVGIVLPDKLKENWHLIREPDRSGLKKAIRLSKGSIDLCHYDSDKKVGGAGPMLIHCSGVLLSQVVYSYLTIFKIICIFQNLFLPWRFHTQLQNLMENTLVLFANHILNDGNIF